MGKKKENRTGDEIFEGLLEAVKEMVAIENGEIEPEPWQITYEESIKATRARFGMTQAEFAALLGISRRTLEKWELGTRIPSGPAGVLLAVASKHPECLLDVTRGRADGSQASGQAPA